MQNWYLLMLVIRITPYFAWNRFRVIFWGFIIGCFILVEWLGSTSKCFKIHSAKIFEVMNTKFYPEFIRQIQPFKQFWISWNLKDLLYPLHFSNQTVNFTYRSRKYIRVLAKISFICSLRKQHHRQNRLRTPLQTLAFCRS